MLKISCLIFTGAIKQSVNCQGAGRYITDKVLPDVKVFTGKILPGRRFLTGSICHATLVHSQKANAPSTQLRTFGKPTWIYTVWTYLYHNAFTNPNEFILSLQYCNYWYKWINCSQHHFLPPWLHCSKMNLYSCFRNSLRTLFYRINSILKQYSLK